MAYSDSFPAVRPVFQADFANGGRIDPRASYTRSTTGTYFGTAKHLSSENLLPYSNDVSSSEWTKSFVTVDSVNNSSPDGGSDASLILETADTGSHTYYDGFSCVSGTSYSFTVYLKANGRTKVNFKPQATSTIVNVQFDLTAVTSTVTSGSADSHSITAIGSTGWYKCAVTATATATGTGYTQVSLVDGSGNISYAGDTTKGIYCWGHGISSTGQTTLNETSGQIHREYAPTLQTAAINAPRFEYSASDGESMGVLIESASTNLVTRSSELDDAGWTKGALNIDANASISVDGTLTADLLRPTTASGAHYAVTGASTTASSTYTASAYVKAAGYSKVRLFFYQSSPPNTHEADATFTLSGSGSAITSVGSSTITAVGGGYYRISVTGVVGSSYSILQIRPANDAGTDNFAGDGYSGILCTGVQFELGSHASSLISTSGSAVTRAADSLSMPISSTGYTGGPFTLMAEATSPGGDSYYAPAALHLDNSNQVVIYTNSFQGRLAAATSDGTANTLLGVRADGKTILSGDTNDLSAVMNGATPVTDSSYVLPDLSGANLYIGSRNGSSSPLNGHVKRVALFGEALSDSNLISLTK